MVAQNTRHDPRPADDRGLQGVRSGATFIGASVPDYKNGAEEFTPIGDVPDDTLDDG